MKHSENTYRELAEKIYQHFRKENIEVSREEVQAYFSGEMDSRKKHQLEEKMLASDFESEAFEGFSEHGDAKQLKKTDARFEDMLHRKNGSNNRSSAFQKLMIAASIAVLCLISYFSYDYFKNKIDKQSELALQEKKSGHENGDAIEVEEESFDVLQKNKEKTKKDEDKADEKALTDNMNDYREKAEQSPPKPEKAHQPKEDQSQSDLPFETVVDEEKEIADMEETVLEEDESQQAFGAVSETRNRERQEAEQPVGNYYRSVSGTHEETKESAPENDNSGNYPTWYYYNQKVADYREEYSKEYEKEKKAEETNVPPQYQNESDKKTKTATRANTGEVEEVTYHQLLDQAMYELKEGNYQAAIDKFSIILQHHPENVNAQFYSGLSHYHLGNYKKALKLLDKAMSNEVTTLNQEAQWYKALTLIKLSDKKEAEKILKQIVSENGFYSDKAREKLKEIK